MKLPLHQAQQKSDLTPFQKLKLRLCYPLLTKLHAFLAQLIKGTK